MSSTKRKKVTKYRGSKTHGGGSMKKRRGAGHRGGRGRAGSGKRGDANKPSYWKTWEMGSHGFVQPNANTVTALNVRDLEKQLDSLVQEGKVTEKSGSYTIDLSDLGVNKLLGAGSVTKKWNITVEQASASAVSKVEAANGSVTVTNPNTKEPKDKTVHGSSKKMDEDPEQDEE